MLTFFHSNHHVHQNLKLFFVSQLNPRRFKLTGYFINHFILHRVSMHYLIFLLQSKSKNHNCYCSRQIISFIRTLFHKKPFLKSMFTWRIWAFSWDSLWESGSYFYNYDKFWTSFLSFYTINKKNWSNQGTTNTQQTTKQIAFREHIFKSLHIARTNQNHLKCSITSLIPTPSKHHLIKTHVALKKIDGRCW